MRFSRLRLNGFKSFVDPADLVIADGLTGVVGPNGCGKSNLLEALRWVMGENRPSAMRGGGMEDVIFAGASTRPARNFAEVALTIDNTERLAPAGFNDTDTLEVVRRITRDAGSAYKANTKDMRARDVQMLFADASTGAHSPALVRQGQISELINAKPKARRRILEEAAGISGLYQRRHEAELKLKGAETNLARVEDVIEALATQLAQLARQARQAARYREIGSKLRQSEGVLLYRRWAEADAARLAAQEALTERTTAASAAERAARTASEARDTADEALPPLREEEAIAGSILQRLQVERDSLNDREARAVKAIETLGARIEQLSRDIERETGLNGDAVDTIARLEEEQAELAAMSQGFGNTVEEAEAAAAEGAAVLQTREGALSEMNEDVARLAARHQSVHRMLEDAQKTLTRAEGEATQARETVASVEADVTRCEAAFAEAEKADAAARAAAEAAEAALAEADDARGDVQSREADARAARSEAEGETGALTAEVAALRRLVERDTAEGGQILDLLSVAAGYEKALGAALADDLRAPAVSVDAPSGWAELDGYAQPQSLPAGVSAMSNHVTVPAVLGRRISQIGLVDASDGARPARRPAAGPATGQHRRRPVALGTDFAQALQTRRPPLRLRLQQLNRLQELKQDLEGRNPRALMARNAPDEHLRAELARLTEADNQARAARRDADRAATRGKPRAVPVRGGSQHRCWQVGKPIDGRGAAYRSRDERADITGRGRGRYQGPARSGCRAGRG